MCQATRAREFKALDILIIGYKMYENIALFLGVAFGAFLFQTLFNSAVLWIASKIIKLDKQDYVTAVRTSAVCTAALFVLLALSFVPSLLIPGGSLITLLLLALLSVIGLVLCVYLIGKFYEADWKNAILAFVIVSFANIIVGVILSGLMFFGVVFWQLGVFNAGQGDMVVTGFVKMQPLMPTIAYHGSKFTASFTNAAGTTASITDISVKESISGTDCPVEPLKGQSIRAGGTFTIKGDCGQKNAGESYDLVVTITYSATIGGISSTHTDTGHIKGQAETGGNIDSMPSVDQMGASNLGSQQADVTGFVRMQPLTPTILYTTDGAYAVTLTNALGTTMNVTTVSLGDEASENCGSISVNDEGFTDGKGNVRVKSGQIISVKASCPEKNAGESYGLSMSIEYSATMGGIVTSHKEAGRIKGIVVA
jgi:hypothetical protein